MKRFPSIVRLPKQKRFQYPARYYDENRERFEELHRRAEAHQSTEQEDTENRFRGAFKAPRPSSSNSRIALIFLIGFILLGSFWLWLNTGMIGIVLPGIIPLYFITRHLFNNNR